MPNWMQTASFFDNIHEVRSVKGLKAKLKVIGKQVNQKV
jgi:hypothetical protein